MENCEKQEQALSNDVQFARWEKQKELIKRTVCKNSTEEEFLLFLHVAKKTGLDPLLKQIYSVPRGCERTIQTSIDGLRLIACRSGEYMPGEEPTFCYDESGNLISATARIKKMDKNGMWHDISHTVFFREFYKKGAFWDKMPHVMLAKTAEAACLRKAFPDCQKIYIEEEMSIEDDSEDDSKYDLKNSSRECQRECQKETPKLMVLATEEEIEDLASRFVRTAHEVLSECLDLGDVKKYLQYCQTKRPLFPCVDECLQKNLAGLVTSFQRWVAKNTVRE